MVVSKPLVLLGQYNLLAPHQGDIYHQPEAPMEENDDDTLGESDNIMTRVELHKGLLWIENDEALPLLASTQVLLEYLGHSIPTKEEGPGTVVMPTAKSLKGQPNESRAEEAKQEDPKDECENGKDGNGKDENGVDEKEDAKKENSDGNGAKEAVTKPQMRPEHAALQSLERITDLTPSKIRPAVGDIRKLRQRDYSKQKSRGERMTVEEKRLIALENQRERLQRQKSEQSDDNDEDPDQQEVGKSDADDDDGENVDGEDPWLTIVRTLNSLQVLLPVLIPILFHPERNAKDLTIGSANIQTTKRRRGGRCWLLGKYKFDVTSVGECKFVYRQLEEIMGFLGTSNESEVPSWPDTVEHTMRTCLRIATDASPELVSHVPNYPWVGPFEGKDQTVIQRLTSTLDKKFGIHDTSDPAERESYLKAIETLHARVHALLKKAYKDARLSIYGSCLSDLSLGKSSDVDMSLHIEKMQKIREDFEEGRTNPSKYQKDVKSHVYKVCRQLEHLREEFGGMDPVWRARIPVVRGTYKKAENPYSDDGSLNFDICFLNDIAVANSELLREYSLVDIRVKQLMVEVKRWASANGLNSAKDNFLSSYAWMNMVIFFLQCIGFVPNLQSAELMEKVGFKRDAKNYWHNINSLETHFLKWEMAREVWELPPTLSTLSVTGLLYGFFRFYASDYPRAFLMVSVKRGKESLLPKTLFRKRSLFLSIEDPFETYDSHCPHDLGTPVNEIGDCIIVKCLQEAEMFLRDALLRALDEKDETAQSTLVDSLWRKPSETQSGNTGEKGKNNQGGGRNQKSKQQPKQKQKQQPNQKQQQKRQTKEHPKQQQQKQQPKVGPKDQPTEHQKQQQQTQKATGEDDKTLVDVAPPSAATPDEPAQAVTEDPSRAEFSEEIAQGATNEVSEVVIEAETCGIETCGIGMRPTRSAASAAGPSEKTTSGASNQTQPGKNGSSHSGNASVASRRSSSASLEKYEIQPSKPETAKELNGHHDSSSTTNVLPEKSVHNTRLRNGIQKLKVPTEYSESGDRDGDMESAIRKSASILAGLNSRACNRALLQDANAALDRIVMPMMFPWLHHGDHVVRAIPRDIDEMVGVTGSTSDELEYTSFGRSARMSSVSDRFPDGMVAAARRSSDPGVIEHTFFLPPSLMQELDSTSTGPLDSKDEVDEPGELSYRAYLEGQSRKRHREEQGAKSRKTTLISLQVGSTSSRSTIFDYFRDSRKALLLPCVLPKEVQDGRMLSQTVANAVAKQLGSYNRYSGAESSSNRKRQGVGRARLIWSEKDAKRPSQRPNYSSILTGERLENGTHKRPRGVRVSVRFNGRILSTSEDVARRHEPILADALVNFDAPEVQLMYNQRIVSDAFEADASSDRLEDADHSQCTLDPAKLLSKALGDRRNADDSGETTGPSEQAFSIETQHATLRVISPRYECLPVEDGAMQVLCAAPGAFVASRKSTSDTDRSPISLVVNEICDHMHLCGVCWADIDQPQLGSNILTCAQCSIKVHGECMRGTTTNEPWECPLCNTKSLDPPTTPETVRSRDCVVCGTGGGVIMSHTKGWVHDVCRIWTDLDFEASTVSTNRCDLCSHQTGLMTTCAAANCKVMFHPMCAVLSSKATVMHVTKSDRSVEPDGDAFLCTQFSLSVIQASSKAETAYSNGSTELPVAFCGYHNPRRRSDCFSLPPESRDISHALRIPPRRYEATT